MELPFVIRAANEADISRGGGAGFGGMAEARAATKVMTDVIEVFMIEFLAANSQGSNLKWRETEEIEIEGETDTYHTFKIVVYAATYLMRPVMVQRYQTLFTLSVEK